MKSPSLRTLYVTFILAASVGAPAQDTAIADTWGGVKVRKSDSRLLQDRRLIMISRLEYDPSYRINGLYLSPNGQHLAYIAAESSTTTCFPVIDGEYGHKFHAMSPIVFSFDSSRAGFVGALGSELHVVVKYGNVLGQWHECKTSVKIPKPFADSSRAICNGRIDVLPTFGLPDGSSEADGSVSIANDFAFTIRAHDGMSAQDHIEQLFSHWSLGHNCTSIGELVHTHDHRVASWIEEVAPSGSGGARVFDLMVGGQRQTSISAHTIADALKGSAPRGLRIKEISPPVFGDNASTWACRLALVSESGRHECIVGSGVALKYAASDVAVGAMYEEVGQPRWNKDGKTVAYRARRQSGSECIVIGNSEQAAWDSVSDPAICANESETIYCALREGWPMLVRGKEAMKLSCDLASDPVLSPDGKEYALWTERGGIQTLWKGKKQITSCKGKLANRKTGSLDDLFGVSDPVFTPDGRHLAWYEVRGYGENYNVFLDGVQIVEGADKVSNWSYDEFGCFCVAGLVRGELVGFSIRD